MFNFRRTFKDILISDISNLTQIKKPLIAKWINDKEKNLLIDHIQVVKVYIYNVKEKHYYRILCLLNNTNGMLKLESEIKEIKIKLDHDLTCENEITLLIE